MSDPLSTSQQFDVSAVGTVTMLAVAAVLGVLVLIGRQMNSKWSRITQVQVEVFSRKGMYEGVPQVSRVFLVTHD